MVTDGVFKNNDVFRVIPPPPAQLLTEQFRHAVLDFLCEEGRITETFKQRLLGWAHSGFSVYVIMAGIVTAAVVCASN